MSLAKILAMAAVFAVSSATPTYPAAVVKHGAPSHSHIERQDNGYGNSRFNYGVADGYTGDVHSRDEKTGNHGVHGSYSLGDPNGYQRTVDYVADYGGVRQSVRGSENGLYVNAPDFQITPNAAPLKKVATYVHSAPAYGHGHPANYASRPHGLNSYSAGAHGYRAPAYGGHGYGAPVDGSHAYGGHGYGAPATHGGYGQHNY